MKQQKYEDYSQRTQRRFARAGAATAGRCFYCGFRLYGEPCRGILIVSDCREPVLDHKHPSKRGGLTCSENLVLSCANCNSRKNAFTTDEFRFLSALRAGNLNFVFPFEAPRENERDWICPHSSQFEKELMLVNYPSSAARYKSTAKTKPASWR